MLNTTRMKEKLVKLTSGTLAKVKFWVYFFTLFLEISFLHFCMFGLEANSKSFKK
jgi:hypothetical protein